MKTYTVYLPPEGHPHNDEFTARFLQDGKSWFAIILPPLWLLWHRLWWSFIVYMILMVIISMLAFTPWVDAALFLSVIPGAYLFLEGHELIRRKYERKGWKFVGVVLANDIEEAELRYYYSRNQADSAGPYTPPTINSGPADQNRPDIQTSQARPQPIGLFPLDETT